MRLNELALGKLKHLITQEEVATFDPSKGNFVFPRFEFTSDISTTVTPVEMKTFILEIYE